MFKHKRISDKKLIKLVKERYLLNIEELERIEQFSCKLSEVEIIAGNLYYTKTNGEFRTDYFVYECNDDGIKDIEVSSSWCQTFISFRKKVIKYLLDRYTCC